MKTKNYFLSLLGTAVLSILFVSCSADNEQKTTKTVAQNKSLARSGEPISGHRGTLTIINNTAHQFSNVYFRCFKTANSDGQTSELQQLIKILPNSNITLTNFESTQIFGMCQANDDKWTTTNYTIGVTGSITGLAASTSGYTTDGYGNFMTKYYEGEGLPLLESVYWSSMGDNTTYSDDGNVRFRFKYYEEFANGLLIFDAPQSYGIGATHYIFTASIAFNADGLDHGNTTITMDEVSY